MPRPACLSHKPTLTPSPRSYVPYLFVSKVLEETESPFANISSDKYILVLILHSDERYGHEDLRMNVASSFWCIFCTIFNFVYKTMTGFLDHFIISDLAVVRPSIRCS